MPVASERAEFLAIAEWPAAHTPSSAEQLSISRFDVVREAVSALRQVRSDYAIPPGKLVDAIITSPKNQDLIEAHALVIGRLARATVRVGGKLPTDGAAHVVLSDGSELIVPLGGVVDLSRECARLRTELEQLEAQLHSLSQRLRNEGFTSRAPASVVEAERKKEGDWIRRREQLTEKVKALCGD